MHLLAELSPESISRVKLTFVEEGMEWHTFDAEGDSASRRLLPE